MSAEPVRPTSRTSVWDDGVPTASELSVVDWLLTTTRANRRTLDVTRPVDLGLLEHCLEIALQAPIAHNHQQWHWLVVTDAGKRAALADLYVRAWTAVTRNQRPRSRRISGADQSVGRSQVSAQWLAEHLHEVPVFVIPCLTGQRPEDPSKTPFWYELLHEGGIYDDELGPSESAFWGSIFPAVWSFQLALRSRGLGSVMTVMHLAAEKQAAKILGIPENVTQAGLIPVAHLTRTVFKPARRHPLHTRLSWEEWHGTRPAGVDRPFPEEEGVR